MEWILIVIMLSNTTQLAITTAEFTSKDKCMAAAAEIKEFSDTSKWQMMTKNIKDKGIKTFCMEK